MSDHAKPTLIECDHCGELFTFYELAETIEEEYLCEYCASRIPRAGDEDDD